MKTNNIFFKSFIYFVFATLVIFEYALPYVGPEKGISLSLLLFLFLVKSKVIPNILLACLFAYTVDSIFLITPLGFFCLLYIVYFYVIKYINNRSIVEGVLLIIYVVNYIAVAVFFTGFNAFYIAYSILFYLVVRILFLFLLRT